MEPEPGLLAGKDEYKTILREVFADAYKQDVVLRAFVNASFQKEEVVGIRQTGSGFEAFAMTPSASVWDTEYDRLMGGHVKTIREAPEPKDKAIEDYKKSLPRDYHHIKIRTALAALPTALADRIRKVWEKMLLDAHYEKESPAAMMMDGTTCYFSMWVYGHGDIGAQGTPDNSDSKVSKLSQLAETLSKYANGNLSADELAKGLNGLE